MAVQQLIYESAIPLSSIRHREFSVEMDGTYPFARRLNSVPLLGVEFPFAALELPIVFAGEGDTMCPAAVLGLRSQQNAFVGAADDWQGRYVPAFLRRYPFVYASTPQSQRYTLCVDEACAGLNREGRGQRLFDDAGKPTPFIEGVLKFLDSYARQFKRTQAFCRQLQELKLLQPMQAQWRTEDGRQIALSGFQSVNRAKLRELPPDVLSTLAKADELELIYLHLQSLRNFMSVGERMAQVDQAHAEGGLDGATLN